MQYKISTKKITDTDGDCTLLAIFNDAESGLAMAGKAALAFDKELGGQLDELLIQGDYTGKLGDTHLVPVFTDSATQRLLLVGCGDRKSF